jgi:hypothetical protein
LPSRKIVGLGDPGAIDATRVSRFAAAIGSVEKDPSIDAGTSGDVRLKAFLTCGELPCAQTATGLSGYMHSFSVTTYVEIDSEPFPNVTVQVSKESVGVRISSLVSAPVDLASWNQNQELFLSLLTASYLPDFRYSLV